MCPKSDQSEVGTAWEPQVTTVEVHDTLQHTADDIAVPAMQDAFLPIDNHDKGNNMYYK